MKLNLSVSGKILASVPVDSSKIENEYYLKAFRRFLLIRHHQTLRKLQNEPSFFLEPIADPRKKANRL